MRCHRCRTEVADERPGVRAACARCAAWLHCCRNCDFYLPGAHDDCREPAAERVADKESGNFCEHFRPATGQAVGGGTDSAAGARERLARLFTKKRPDGG